MRNAKLEHTVNYRAAQASMRIIELENRYTGNRTVGSNPNGGLLLFEKHYCRSGLRRAAGALDRRSLKKA